MGKIVVLRVATVLAALGLVGAVAPAVAQVAGLGAMPGDVVINGEIDVFNRARRACVTVSTTSGGRSRT